MLIPQAFAHTVWQLILVRFVMGIFMGGLLPKCKCVNSGIFPDSMISRAFSFIYEHTCTPVICFAVIGGFLAGFIGIEGLFIVSGGLLAAQYGMGSIQIVQKPVRMEQSKRLKFSIETEIL